MHRTHVDYFLTKGEHDFRCANVGLLSRYASTPSRRARRSSLELVGLLDVITPNDQLVNRAYFYLRSNTGNRCRRHSTPNYRPRSHVLADRLVADGYRRYHRLPRHHRPPTEACHPAGSRGIQWVPRKQRVVLSSRCLVTRDAVAIAEQRTYLHVNSQKIDQRLTGNVIRKSINLVNYLLIGSHFTS